jgi:hypothetical protein
MVSARDCHAKESGSPEVAPGLRNVRYAPFSRFARFAFRSLV